MPNLLGARPEKGKARKLRKNGQGLDRPQRQIRVRDGELGSVLDIGHLLLHDSGCSPPRALGLAELDHT